MSSKITLEWATQADVEEFYGKAAPFSCRAVIARLDGVPVGLGGLYRLGNHMVVFSDIREAMKPYKKEIIRACRMVLEISKKYTVLVSYPDPEQSTSDTFGKHFGFVAMGVKNGDHEMMVRVNK